MKKFFVTLQGTFDLVGERNIKDEICVAFVWDVNLSCGNLGVEEVRVNN